MPATPPALPNNPLTVISFLSLTFSALWLSASLASAMPPHHKKTVDAIEKCLGTTKAAIEQGSKKRPVIICDIPFSFKEQEIDAVINASGSAAKTETKNEEDTTPKTAEDRANEERLKSASKATVKSIINVKHASCLAKVKVNTALIEKAIAMKEGEITLPAQPVNCELTTRANKAEKVAFTFRPTGKFEGNCLKEFSPQMGNFTIACTFCRLNFVAKTLSYWVNRLGSRFGPGINRAIGKQCKA